MIRGDILYANFKHRTNKQTQPLVSEGTKRMVWQYHRRPVGRCCDHLRPIARGDRLYDRSRHPSLYGTVYHHLPNHRPFLCGRPAWSGIRRRWCATAMIAAGLIAQYWDTHPEYLFAAVILAGIFQLIMGFCRVGNRVGLSRNASCMAS